MTNPPANPAPSNLTDRLTAADEVALAATIEAGVFAQHLLDTGRGPDCDATAAELAALVAEGEAAWERMWMANIGLVKFLSVRMAHKTGMALDDLIAEGFLGLAEAIMRWDHTRGSKFSTTAWMWINNRLYRAARVTHAQKAELQAELSDIDHWVSPTEGADVVVADREAPRWLDELPAPERGLLMLLANPDLSADEVRATVGLKRSAYHRLRTRARELGAEAWRRHLEAA